MIFFSAYGRLSPPVIPSYTSLQNYEKLPEHPNPPAASRKAVKSLLELKKLKKTTDTAAS
ncbi:hypothetical protein HMPREF9141_2221 [Prevotella multiformis DSM 16608]|uniref:Uncharacterized protein n=1 Tax=Prevotella multiformis DSM 16608 TaxID=888743 RepID=F0F9F4_9BACT|nr:hypothetical protein HMPREF9141_2221 [Prevotella multiformis DSM 16608]